jgi:WS/DGAT/MGAT family acyltransferase
MAPATKSMTPVDAAWYHMDGPVNLAQVTGIVLTKTPLDFERVKEVYRRRVARFPRFTQRVVESGFPIATPHWQDLPGFEVEQQLHHVALPPPHDHAALTEFLSDLASTPLDRGRPLWDVHVVDQVDGGSAFVLRFHHCIGDGTAMMAFSGELFDETPDAPLGTLPVPKRQVEAGLVDRIVENTASLVDWSTRTMMSTVEAGLETVRHPERVIEKAGLALDGAAVLVSELLKPSDPKSPLKGEFGARKRVAWSAPVSLQDIKTIGARVGAKVNDVLVAGMTGALRHYLSGRGVDVEHVTLRAMVPVDLRPRERALDLGNEFGLVILDLAIAAEDPLARVRLTKANMDALKRSPEAVAIMALFNLFGRGPKIVEDFAVDLFSSKASLVLTNVAGPLRPLYLAGTAIDRIMFWVPHPGKQLGMGISILSYNGNVSLAVISDAHLVPDPEAITDRFGHEFAEMLRLAREPVAAAPARAAKARQPRARKQTGGASRADKPRRAPRQSG